MREKPVTCFSSAADAMKGPEGYFTSPAFSNARWTTAGEQRNEDMRLFCRKLLSRLDKLGMPFYPKVGLMDLRIARHRYVTGIDPWSPIESPFLDGVAIEFAHCILDEMDWRCWALFAEVAFDVGKLAQIPVLWGGFADCKRPGLFMVRWSELVPAGFHQDARTYCSRIRSKLPLEWV